MSPAQRCAESGVRRCGATQWAVGLQRDAYTAAVADKSKYIDVRWLTGASLYTLANLACRLGSPPHSAQVVHLVSRRPNATYIILTSVLGGRYFIRMVLVCRSIAAE
jgi:hypothetical protein